MPQGFNERAGTPAEHEDVASEWIAAEALLHKQRQTLHAFPHVGVAGGDPNSHACSYRNHRRSRTCSTRARAAASTLASTMMRRSLPTIITMRPLADAAASSGAVSAATTIAGTKPACCASG